MKLYIFECWQLFSFGDLGDFSIFNTNKMAVCIVKLKIFLDFLFFTLILFLVGTFRLSLYLTWIDNMAMPL
jgi:hypothetical protein